MQRAWRACTNEGHQVCVSGGRREDMVLYAAKGLAGQAGVPVDLWGEPRVCLYVGLLQCVRRQVVEGGSIANGWSRACRYFREGFQKATADLVERELQRFERPEEVEIFFSAHGVPVSYVEQVRALGHALKISTSTRAGDLLQRARRAGLVCGAGARPRPCLKFLFSGMLVVSAASDATAMRMAVACR